MLKKINAGRVEGDEFYVHVTGRECLEYGEGKKIIEFEWNYDPKTRKTYVYISKDKSLNDSERTRIIKNITEAFKLFEEDFEII